MKIKLHIPTEQYGFVEIEMEKNPEVHKSPTEVVEDAIELYNTSKIAQNGSGEGLGAKEWNKALDGYLDTNTMDSEVYASMSREQQNIIQEIKRSVKRINYEKND